MAGDSLAVMDALGWSRAHVVGSSLGGMIAQTMAIGHPERVLSLTSISSTPCWRRNGSRIRTILRIAWMERHRPTTLDEATRRSIDVNRIVGSRGYPFDEDSIRLRAKLAYERGSDPDGVSRQIAAVTAGPDRRRALGTLEIPAVVIHGEDDPIVKVKWGRATADAIPGARFLSFPGMGHDLPEQLWPAIVDAIRALADQATPT
jgi:pimeloyl-ACP methyl ester carboxylesterase